MLKIKIYTLAAIFDSDSFIYWQSFHYVVGNMLYCSSINIKFHNCRVEDRKNGKVQRITQNSKSFLSGPPYLCFVY